MKKGTHMNTHIDALVQDCSNSIANALELLQSCTKPSTRCTLFWSAEQQMYFQKIWIMSS